MLELQFALLKNELDHDAGNQGKSDGCHKDIVVSTCSLFDILELLINWVGSGSNVEVHIWIIESDSKNGLVHVLRVKACDILRRHVHVVDDVVLVSDPVSLVNVVRTVPVWE